MPTQSGIGLLVGAIVRIHGLCLLVVLENEDRVANLCVPRTCISESKLLACMSSLRMRACSLIWLAWSGPSAEARVPHSDLIPNKINIKNFIVIDIQDIKLGAGPSNTRCM